MKFKIAILALFLVLNPGCLSGKRIAVYSPDGSNKLIFTAGFEQDGIRYSAFTLETGKLQVIIPSPLKFNA